MSIDQPLRWITIEEVIAIHERVIEETGGGSGILSKDGIENALDSPLSTFSGKDLYPTLFHKVGQLIRAINSHVFVDGNKRVSLVAADVVLRRNGFRLKEDSALEYLFLEIADEGKTVDEIVGFLKQHTVRYFPS